MTAGVAHPTHLSDLAGRGLVTRAAMGTTAGARTLPLLPAFGDLVPHGTLQRGSVVGCSGPAAVSLALALAAAPSQEGAWVAVAGLPSLGLAAAVEAGVSLERLVAVHEAADDAAWADILAACIDGFDVVLLGPGTQTVRPATARRLVARLQSRGAVAVTVGAPVFSADLRFDATGVSWVGLGDGHGVARGRTVRVELSGRRVPRPRHVQCWLPAADGRMHRTAVPATEPVVEPATAVVPLRRTG